MRCFQCKKEIKYEHKSILLNTDGDFACDEKCKSDFIKERDKFFENIGDDTWYKNNYPEFNRK